MHASKHFGAGRNQTRYAGDRVSGRPVDHFAQKPTIQATVSLFSLLPFEDQANASKHEQNKKPKPMNTSSASLLKQSACSWGQREGSHESTPVWRETGKFHRRTRGGDEVGQSSRCKGHRGAAAVSLDLTTILTMSPGRRWRSISWPSSASSRTRWRTKNAQQTRPNRK